VDSEDKIPLELRYTDICYLCGVLNQHITWLSKSTSRGHREQAKVMQQCLDRFENSCRDGMDRVDKRKRK
jgi:hypothetical protein